MCAESMLIATPLYFNLEFPETTHFFVVIFLLASAFTGNKLNLTFPLILTIFT